MSIKEKAKKIKRDIPVVFLCLKDKRTPCIAKVFAFITVAYALSPIDLIPDFIPVLGYIDDLVILPLLISLSIHFIPDGLIESNRKKSGDMWKDGKPKKWYYAIPIIVIWGIIAVLIIRLFM